MIFAQYKPKLELAQKPISKRNNWITILSLSVLILVALIFAYQPVMFDFLSSDDFYIVGWLDQCKHDISLLFQAVYEGTPYYRPVLNLFWFGEYLLCGHNGFNFRLVSMTYLLVTAGLLWLLVDAFSQTATDKPKTSLDSQYKLSSNWCLFSVGFFLLFPLHTEPVNWFVSTTELLANIFILSSLLFYIYAQNKKTTFLSIISYAFAACAFLTKEIAVILPAILVLYEFLVGSNIKQAQTTIFADYGQRIISTIMKTAPYWTLLVMYLCLRKIITGEFLGSWSNTVFHFTDNQMMFKSWWQSLKMIISPISSASFGNDFILKTGWLFMLADLAFLSFASMLRHPQKRALLLFFVSWFFVCLLPMAKLLLIAPDLLDARYGYIASVPLCILLMFGLAMRNKPLGIGKFRYFIFAAVLAFSSFILHGNNLAWTATGELVNNMISSFRSIQKDIPSQQKVYFVNIPVKQNGVAIAGLKSIDSMNHIPFTKTNYDNYVWLLDEDQSLPIGIMSATHLAERINWPVYYLDALDQRFHPIDFVANTARAASYDLDKPYSVGKNTVFEFDALNLNCQLTDAIILKLNIKRSGSSFKNGFASLSFRNDINMHNTEDQFILVPIMAKEGSQTIIFPVRGKPIWSFGGICHSMTVSFPKNFAAEVESAKAISIVDSMPKLAFLKGYDKQAGQINVSSKDSSAEVLFDASSIENCAALKVEIVNSSEYFKELNSLLSDSKSLLDLNFKQSKGQINFDRPMFKEAGYYKVRLCPLDKDGKQCGFCSDHFMLNVSN